MPQQTESIFLAAFFFPSAAAVLIFLMKYVAAVLAARARHAQEHTYRELAAGATAAQAETAATLATLDAHLGEVQSRLANLERILKDVE